MADATKDDHYDGKLNAQSLIVLTTLSISLYNSIELLLLIFVTFKKWSGNYFYSLLVASFGVLPYSLGYTISYFGLTKSYIGLILSNIGWIAMVTGQSFVLYSRLHLVLSDRRLLRAVLAMIIVDAIIFHIPTTTLNFCNNYDNSPEVITAAGKGYKVYEKIQMTGFCIQEFIISGIYLWKAAELLKVISRDDARRTMWQLFTINVIIVIMDIALLAVEYRNLRIYEQTFKGVVYSIKLKLEYAILGKLVHLVKSGGQLRGSVAFEERPREDRVDTSRSRGDSAAMAKRRPSRPEGELKGSSEHMEDLGFQRESGTISSDQTSGRQGANHELQQRLSTRSSVSGLPYDSENPGDMYAAAMRQITRE